MIARRTSRMGRKGLKGRGVRSPHANGDQEAPLTRAELAEFRKMLLEKRQSLLDDISVVQREDAFETTELLESEWGLFCEIDLALERIQDGTYGVCQATGAPITRARLRACPWAKYCIAYARLNERKKRPVIRGSWLNQSRSRRPIVGIWEELLLRGA